MGRTLSYYVREYVFASIEQYRRIIQFLPQDWDIFMEDEHADGTFYVVFFRYEWWRKINWQNA